jgi:hypothetical protein
LRPWTAIRAVHGSQSAGRLRSAPDPQTDESRSLREESDRLGDLVLPWEEREELR